MPFEFSLAHFCIYPLQIVETYHGQTTMSIQVPIVGMSYFGYLAAELVTR